MRFLCVKQRDVYIDMYIVYAYLFLACDSYNLIYNQSNI